MLKQLLGSVQMQSKLVVLRALRQAFHRASAFSVRKHVVVLHRIPLNQRVAFGYGGQKDILIVSGVSVPSCPITDVFVQLLAETRLRSKDAVI